MLGSKNMPITVISQLARYNANAMVTSYIDALLSSSHGPIKILPEEFSNFTHESMSQMIYWYFSQQKSAFSLFGSQFSKANALLDTGPAHYR
jgi:hypothetical protein